MSFRKKKIFSTRFAQRKRENRVFKLSLITLAFLLVIFGLSFLSKIDKFLIKEIQIEGNSVTASREISEITQNNLRGSHLRLFSKSNFLLYPKGRIEEELLDNFERIESVDLVVRNFGNLLVSVTERRPYYLWCGDSLRDNSSDEKEGCYFIDDDGLIYSRSPRFSGNVFLRFYGFIKDSLNPVGENFLPESKFKSLTFFINSLEQFGLEPLSLNRLEADDVEIYLEQGGKILFTLEQDVVKLSEDLDSILKDKVFKEEGPIENLSYIDLRFGNKVYYRFR